MVYEHDNEYIKLRIILKDVVGKYRVYRDGNKSMGFILDDDSLFKVSDIFTYIAEKINTPSMPVYMKVKVRVIKSLIVCIKLCTIRLLFTSLWYICVKRDVFVRD